MKWLSHISDNFKKKVSCFLSQTWLYKRVRSWQAFFLRYSHIWRLSSVKKSIDNAVKRTFESICSFNLLNFIFAWLGRRLERIGFTKAAESVSGFMQDKNGLRRHILVRYLIKELFLYFLIAFVFFFMVFFVNQILLVAENILKKRVPVIDVLRLITYSLPMIIAQSAPFATLVGFLMCLGRLATENEILILRASGHGYRIILFPVLFLGFIISIASFFVNDYLLPLGNINYSKLYRSILVSNPAVELESNSVKRTSDKTLVIGNVSGENVSDMIFFDNDLEGNQRIIVADASSVKKSSELGIIMKLIMNDASVIVLKKGKKYDFDVITARNMELNIFENSLLPDLKRISPRDMTSYDLYQNIKTMKKDVHFAPNILNQYILEFNKKFSLPFASIFFAVLALPLALIFGKHNGQTIGLIIGIFISVLYWAMNIVGQIFSSRSGIGGSVVMWIPDLLIGISGILFYLGLVRK